MQQTLSDDAAMHFTIRQGRLRGLTDALGALVDEVVLEIHADGIEVAAVDVANVGMVDLGVDGDALQAYEATRHTIGLNTARLGHIVEELPHYEPVTLAYDAVEKELTVQSGCYQFVLPTTDPDSLREPPTVPDLSFDGVFEVSARDLQGAIEYADEFGDGLLFGYEPGDETLDLRVCDRLDTKLNGGDRARVTLPLTESLVHSDGAVHTIVPLSYLTDIAPALPQQPVMLRADEEYPLQLAYECPVSEESWIKCKYIIAPRRVDG